MHSVYSTQIVHQAAQGLFPFLRAALWVQNKFDEKSRQDALCVLATFRRVRTVIRRVGKRAYWAFISLSNRSA
jgi:hypothetical protein